jgi:hypothetical protein
LTEGTYINDADEPDIALAGEVRAAQQREPHTQELISLRRKLDHDPPVGDWHYGFKENYNVVNGELRFGSTAKLYVPDVVRQRVIFEHHDVPLVGHPGGEETHRSVSESYHWPTSQRDIRSYVKSCLLCAQYKRRPNQPNAPLRPRQPQRADMYLVNLGNRVVKCHVDRLRSAPPCRL